MDILKHRINQKYYEGFEDEIDVIITLQDNEYHIWEGYFSDIFGNPVFDESGWSGFTEDYNELKNCFDDNTIEVAIIPDEYLQDLLLYKNHTFDYDETKEVLNLLISIMKEAIKINECVLVRVV